MKPLKHWQDLINALLGICIAISPWVMGYQGMTMAMGNAVVVGLALVAAAMGAIFVPRAWEEWTEAGLGLWLMVSPWILGFGMHRDAMLTAVLMGLAVVVLAIWTLGIDKDYGGWWHRDNKVAH